MEFNPYLTTEGADEAKGGGRFIENPASVENIIFQTRGAPLSVFEAQLCDQLMVVFGEGHEELPDVVAALNQSGCVDSEGNIWTEDSFVAQMSQSADALFHAVGENIHG